MKKCRQACIYVGLNDSDTHVQEHDTERYVSILQNVCKAYHVAFSMSQIKGGYLHEDGTYVKEDSLALTFLDVDDEVIKEIAKDLCAFFNQESVMVTYMPAEILFIKESI
ncbi:MAG: DUF3574 domain-containing protein [Erysipelotrichaceae bacterium]|nr:DUF3574 domain-containing protein [Erysipelotrichaceae bacterium]